MVLIAAGLGLAIYLYGLAVCKGALLADMERKQAVFSIGVSALWQIAVLAAGNLAAAGLRAVQTVGNEYPTNAFICMLIFGIMAVQMLIHAVKNEPIEERRMESKDFCRTVFRICFAVGLDIFLIGFAFGLLQTAIWQELIVLAGLPVAGMIGGLYAGYRFGYGQRNGAYVLGGVFLMIGTVLLLLQYW